VTRLRRWVDWALEVTLVFLMSVMVFNVLWQVATRFILRDPSSYTEEMARYLLVWVGLLGASYSVGKGAHLAIDLLPGRLQGWRKEALSLFIEISIFSFALLVLVIGGYRLVSLTLSLGQRSAALRIPLGYVYLVLPLSGALMMFFSGGNVVEGIRGLQRPSGVDQSPQDAGAG
jgi:TRAP-type C4-dicarboxylate transport system permease small subunit